MVRLLELVQQRQRQFSAPPIGPVGMHLGLSDNMWDKAVEHALGGAFTTFLVATTKDGKLLCEIGQQAGVQVSFVVVQLTNPRLYNIGSERRPTGLDPTIKAPWLTLLDVVRVDQTQPARFNAITNYLVDR